MTTPDLLTDIIATHFDPESGSPYWLELQARLGVDVRREVRALDDLVLLGPMDEDALRLRPVEDFIPRRFWSKREEWIIGETGGTTGMPKTTMYDRRDFHQAFISPFLAAAHYRKFPLGENWLFIGPTGPHLIGKAARECARALASADPFAIDFDPRWVKKFPPESLAFRRYLEHVLEQTLRILATQRIGVIFATPKVLVRLIDLLDRRQRDAIHGIHFGGMSLDPAQFAAIAAAFPRAVLISGYGNSLFGMCPEFLGDPDLPLDYFPIGTRYQMQVVPTDPALPAATRLLHPCEPGESGQVVCSRLDRSFLILNLFERDRATLIEPPATCRLLGCTGNGLRNPQPLASETEPGAAAGLY